MSDEQTFRLDSNICVSGLHSFPLTTSNIKKEVASYVTIKTKAQSRFFYSMLHKTNIFRLFTIFFTIIYHIGSELGLVALTGDLWRGGQNLTTDVTIRLLDRDLILVL